MGAGRPHIAAILVRKGVVGSIQEAFDVWLAKGAPAYLDKERLAPDVAVRLAVASRGVPVLAHPLSLQLTPAATSATVAELAGYGLAGVEAMYGRYRVFEREAIAALAAQHGVGGDGWVRPPRNPTSPTSRSGSDRATWTYPTGSLTSSGSASPPQRRERRHSGGRDGTAAGGTAGPRGLRRRPGAASLSGPSPLPLPPPPPRSPRSPAPAAGPSATPRRHPRARR